VYRRLGEALELIAPRFSLDLKLDEEAFMREIGLI
jgi:hypothetical protein